MTTIERPKQRGSQHRHPEPQHVSYRLPSKAHVPRRTPDTPAIPQVRRLDPDELSRRGSTTSTRRPYVRWLGLAALVLVVIGGVALVPSWLDDGSTTAQTPWTPEARGLTAPVVAVQAGPWIAGDRGLVVVEAVPWTPEGRGMATQVIVAETPWNAEDRGLVVLTTAPWTPEDRGMATLVILADAPWNAEDRGLVVPAETPWTPDDRGLTAEE